MKLVIAEKPQLGEAIADALPGPRVSKDGVIQKGDYTIIWAYGHLLELKEPEDFDEKYGQWALEDLPIFFENWGLKVGKDEKLKPGQISKANRLKQIGDLLARADSVIHAGDIDEEGQLLIDEILRWFSYRGPVWRLDTNNTSAPALRKALSHMRKNEECVPDGLSAFGRELSDAVFGFNLTRYFTSKNNGVLLPVGRVQTPTLGLVVQRDLQIESHKKLMYFELDASMNVLDRSVTAKFLPNPEDPNLTEGKILNRRYLEEKAGQLNGRSFSNVVVKKESLKQQPPLPFNLTKLTSYCSHKWGYNPDEVMKITQNLRENYKAITYNRSDCQYLSEDHFREAPETISVVSSNLGLNQQEFDTSIKSRCFNDSKLTAHFAIIPTSEKVDISKMSVRERNVYQAICNYYLAQFLPPASKQRTVLLVELENGEQLKATDTVTLDPGFLAFLNDNNSEEDGSEEEQNPGLSSIPAGTYSGTVTKCDVVGKETKAPARYTQASLAEDMTRIAKYVDDPLIKQLLLDKDKDKTGENGSIGTSATRPGIIKNLIERGFLMERKEGKRIVLISSPKGRDFYKMLPNEVKKADMTAKWWTIQEDIKSGAATPEQMARDVLSTVTTIIGSGVGSLANSAAYAGGGTGVTLGNCPQCGSPFIETQKAYTCSNKSCSCAFFKDNKILAAVGKKMTASIAKSLITKGQAVLRGCKSQKSNREFDCVLVVSYGEKYPRLSLDFDIEPTELGKCPQCGGSITENAKAFSCSNPDCSCVFFKDNRLLASIGKKLTAPIVRSLLSKGKAPLMDCKSPKTGRQFDCLLTVTYGDKYPNLALDFDNPPVEYGNCPFCNSEIVKNKFGFFGCSNWKSGCKFSIPGEICKKKLTDKNVQDLLSKKETPELHGFTGKNGNKFDAKLVLSRDGKVSFKFVDHPKKW